jgi:hypothetical protein
VPLGSLNNYETDHIQLAIAGYVEAFAEAGIALSVDRDFKNYAAVRRARRDCHSDQAFGPTPAALGPDDFWLLAQNRGGEPIAIYYVLRFIADDFYDFIRSQALWFGEPRPADLRFVVDCEIPPFGGEVAYAGGAWVRKDYRGASRQPRVSTLMSRLACAITLRERPFDHETAMIRSELQDLPEATDRKAVSLALGTYKFARVRRLVDGWFPPFGRDAVIHLCHSTRAEAVASLLPPRSSVGARALRHLEFQQTPLVDKHHQLIDAPAVRGKGQQQTSVRK